MPVVQWPLRHPATNLPASMAVVLGRTGTLSGENGIVMADEAMAQGLARGLRSASRGALDRCDVVQYDEVPEGTYDSILMMHHTVLDGLPAHARGLPKWLWVHNPGASTPVELRRQAATTYQRVFHAGRRIADACGFDHLPHAIEDLDMFHQDPYGELHEVGFVGNAVMHSDLTNLLLRLVQDGRRVEVRGSRWKEAGVPSAGPIPMDRAWEVLARSSVCIDHVSSFHVAEGMVSTRVFQVLACESALVSTQDPMNIPEPMRRHVVFVKDMEDAYRAVRKLLSDPVARARLRSGARRTVVHETMDDRARTVWARILADLA